jgi:hypothetical protein
LRFCRGNRFDLERFLIRKSAVLFEEAADLLLFAGD